MWSPTTFTGTVVGTTVVVDVVVVGGIVVVLVVDGVDVEVVGATVGSAAAPERESCHCDST
jgi:hypothetical protein